MKNLSIILFLAIFASCKTVKIDSAGHKELTWNQKHFNTVNPHGTRIRNKVLLPLILKDDTAKVTKPRH